MTLKNGEVFSGIFFGASLEHNESTYILKMVQQIKTTEKSEVNGTQDEMGAFVGVGEDHTMLFDIHDVTDLAVEGVGLGAQDKHQNGNNPSAWPNTINSIITPCRFYNRVSHRH